MQGLQVDINHLNPGVRYKFIKNNGSVYSGNYYRSYLTHDTPPESYLVFDNCINETNGIRQGIVTIPVDFIREIYAIVSAPSGKNLPADIGRNISSYGGRRNAKRKSQKSKKQKRKNKKTKRRNTTRRW
jgi:hypothetical protein